MAQPITLTVSSLVQLGGFTAPVSRDLTCLQTPAVAQEEETRSCAIEDEAPTQRRPATATKSAEHRPIGKRDVREFLERRSCVLATSMEQQAACLQAAEEELGFLYRRALEQKNIKDLVAVVTAFVAKVHKDAESWVAEAKKRVMTEKPRFTVSTVKSSMAKATDKTDQAARLLGILFREGDRYSEEEGRDIAVAILNGLDCKPLDLERLLVQSSDPPARIRQLITLCRGRSIYADLIMVAEEAVNALIQDADWPLGRAAVLLKVFLEDADGHHAFREGDALAEVVKDALQQRIKAAVIGGETADDAVGKANYVFYCMRNPLFLGFADEVVTATYDLLVVRLVALGATLSDAEVTARNCRDNPTDPRKRQGRKQPERRQAQGKPKVEVVQTAIVGPALTQEEVRNFFGAVQDAVADAARTDAERGEPCRTLADLEEEKAQATPAKEPGSVKKLLADDRRAWVEKAFAKAKQAEAEARNAVRFESALPDHMKDKEHYHRFVNALQAAKTRRMRIQQMLEADARLRKEQEKAAQKAKATPDPPKPKDAKKKSKGKGKDRERSQRPERERHAHA